MTREKEKRCADLVKGQYESRNESIKQMLVHYTGQFSDEVDEQADQFIEEFTKTYNEDPSEEEVAKFKENYYKNTEYNEESLMEFPLGHSIEKVIKIELSTGGPADFIKVFLDDTDYITNMTYHYFDWFDGAEIPVKEDDSMWEFAEHYLISIGSIQG